MGKPRPRLAPITVLCETAGRNAPDGAVKVIEAEMRVQAIDFWIRNPDYLAWELMEQYEQSGKLDAGLLQQAEMVMSGDGKAFGLGSMTEAQWKLFTDTMTTEGLYPRGLDFRKAYDLRFIRATFQNFQ